MKIIADNKIPFLRGVLEPFVEVVYLPGKETTADIVRDADALITRTRTICNASLLEGSNVKVIATATIGFDHIDTSWCEGNGILWRNAPGCNSGSVEQYIGALLCHLARTRCLELEKLTLGVVGVGNVGSKVARIAALLGMNFLLCDPPRARREGSSGFSTIEEIMEGSDIVTLHVPLSREGEDATWHLFDEARLASMRPSQILVNSSRGSVVDNKALKACLKSRSIAGAVLDVWEGEPEFDRELQSLLDIATPHIAGYSVDGKANGTAAAVQAVAEVLDLPLEGWRPSQIPAPHQPLEFILDGSGKTRQEILCEAVLHTYDIGADDRVLRAAPGDFERLRGDYPVRREFPAFSITARNVPAEVVDTLRKIGFNVK